MTRFIFQLRSNMFQCYNSLTSTHFKYSGVCLLQLYKLVLNKEATDFK